jgi:hypothetical protein
MIRRILSPTNPDYPLSLSVSQMRYVILSLFLRRIILDVWPSSSRKTRTFNRSGCRRFCVPRDGTLHIAYSYCMQTKLNTSRIIPNYELAPNLQDVEILRVVVRENLTEAVGAYFCSILGRV